MRVDTRLVWPAAAAWTAAWLVVGAPSWAAASAIGLGCGALGALVALGIVVRHAAASRTDRRMRRAVLPTVALCLAAAALVCTAAAAQMPGRVPVVLERAASGHATVSAVGTVTTAPVAGAAGFSSAERIRFEARITVVTRGADRPVAVAAPVLVFGESEGGWPQIGATVVMHGSAQAASPGESVAFLIFVNDPVRTVAAPPWYLGWAEPLRAGLRESAALLPGDGGDLLPGLSIGDTSAVTDSLDTAMKHASLSHLTAVSGANCAVVIAAIVLLGATIGLPRLARLLLALLALAGFVVLVTPEPSVLRAAAMASVVLFSLGLGRPGRGVPALAVAVIGLLAADPWLARSYGLALSVAATAGLLVLAAPLARWLGRWMPVPVALAVAIPLAAQITCQPILVLLDPALPVAGVAANLLAEPAAPVGTVLGLLGCLLLPVLPGVGAACVQLAWLPAAWIAQVARTVDALPALRLPWIGGVAGVVLIAGVSGTALWLALRGRAARNAGRGRTAGALVIVLLLAGGGYGGALLGASVARSVSMPADWRYAACDIGQGDAVLVRDGEHVGLVDVGPDAALLGRCLDELGVHRLDLLVLTHYDLDHVGGIDAVVGRVDRAIVGLPENDRDARIPARLLAGGASVERGSAGMTGRLGALDWQVLWPLPRATSMATGNAGSVTMTFTGAGSTSIFLGDLGEESQDALLAAVAIGHVDVVKVAHHGSADQSAELYRRLHAAVGLISVGADNGYGHPTKRLLEMLARAGTAVLRTDRQGLVLVAPEADGALRVWTERTAGAPGTG